nr:hypothetical protein [Rhizocola hellebori]
MPYFYGPPCVVRAIKQLNLDRDALGGLENGWLDVITRGEAGIPGHPAVGPQKLAGDRLGQSVGQFSPRYQGEKVDVLAEPRVQQVSSAQRCSAEEDYVAGELCGDGGQYMGDRVISPDLIVRDAKSIGFTRQILRGQPEGGRGRSSLIHPNPPS